MAVRFLFGVILELNKFVSIFCLLLLAQFLNLDKSAADARSRKSSAKKSSSHSSHTGRAKHTAHSRSKKHSGKASHVAKHHGRHHKHHVAHRPRYAYPVEMFMMHAPAFDTTPLPEDQSAQIAYDFKYGLASKHNPRALVRAGVVKFHPLRGGIFWRREPVKHIIIHSTETGIPVSAIRVIEGWSGRGRRHPGAQYVVERDGTIYQAVDPDLATVHINILKTLPGINNDNSIGIEMNHCGRQNYPPEMVQAVIRLVNYLQERYCVSQENIITHRYAQQGDHTDPVLFDWGGFLLATDKFRQNAIASRLDNIKDMSKSWQDFDGAQIAAEETQEINPITTTPVSEAPVIKELPQDLSRIRLQPNPLNSPVTSPVQKQNVSSPDMPENLLDD